jgi:hypothetical protein
MLPFKFNINPVFNTNLKMLNTPLNVLDFECEKRYSVNDICLQQFSVENSFSILDELEKDEDDKINELKKKIVELTIENNTLKAVRDKLEEINKEQHHKAICYDRIVNRQSLFKNRLVFCISFLQSVGQYSCVYGSMIRKMFELIFHLQNVDSNNHVGDVLNSDINILFNYKNELDKIEVSKQFYNLCQSLDISKAISEKDNNKVDCPTFGGYKLISINNTLTHITSSNETIPRAKLVFSKNTDTINVEMIGWKYKEIVDFSVNNFMLTNNGLQPLFDYGFLNYLENINFLEARYLFRPDILQTLAFPNNKSIPRTEKCIHLSKMYELISNRLLKILTSDYKIIKHNPIYIETIEDCPITGCKAPYPVVTLSCNHKISIMAYKGILFQTNDTDTQSLRCPLCRNDLKIQFDNSILGHTTKTMLTDLSTLIKQLNIQHMPINNKFISLDAMEQL